MKLKLIIPAILVIVASCNEPETIVTNFVHSDGSITRRIVMKNNENKFNKSDIQVPFDSTWVVRDSLEINEKGDTAWVKRGEKIFASADELTRAYKSDSGANKGISRRAEFRKRFKWFNTEYNYSEIIDKKMMNGYPVGEFLNKDELKWFYSPENVNSEKKNGPDSLKFRAFSDTVERKIGKWTFKSLASEWIAEFESLKRDTTQVDLSFASLKGREEEFANAIAADSGKFDSLWTGGIILKKFLGDSAAVKYKTEADSALEIVTNRYIVDFKNYTICTVMPGKLTGTNGIIDSSGTVLWPVKSDYFLTRPYEMKAESEISNIWAWIVTGLFLVFVSTGILIKKKRKG